MIVDKNDLSKTVEICDDNNCNELVNKRRDYRIDLLRALGISLLILAHVAPPNWLFETRTFDVVLVVFLSGISYSYSTTEKKYFTYVKGRIKHLLLPVELYLIAYFAFFNILSFLGIVDVKFSARDYLLSFSLISGIGLVWIYRVYILMAIEAPIIRKIINKDHRVLILLLPICVIYEKIASFIVGKEGNFWKFIELTVLYAVGYGIVYSIGVVIRFIDLKYSLLIVIVSLSIFIILGYISKFPSINDYKYPPRLYYISYGIFISVLFWMISSCKILEKIGTNRFIMWFSKNSLLIYLWHSIPLRFIEYRIVALKESSFIVKYIFIFSTTLILTYAHLFVKKKVRHYFDFKIRSRQRSD